MAAEAGRRFPGVPELHARASGHRRDIFGGRNLSRGWEHKVGRVERPTTPRRRFGARKVTSVDVVRRYEELDPLRVAGPQDLADKHDRLGMRLVAARRRLARLRAPCGALGGEPLGHCPGAMSCGRQRIFVVEKGGYRLPLGRNTVKAVVAEAGDPTHQLLNRGHRSLGNRRWDDAVQKAMEIPRAWTLWCEETADRDSRLATKSADNRSCVAAR